MKRRGFFKAVGALLFGGLAGGGRAKAKDTSGVFCGKCSGSVMSDMTCFSCAEEKSKWKMYRAIYDYDGLSYIEGDAWGDGKFKAAVAHGEDTDWIIGRAVRLNGETHIVAVLEGKKENLEYVLALQQTSVAQTCGTSSNDEYIISVVQENIRNRGVLHHTMGYRGVK